MAGNSAGIRCPVTSVFMTTDWCFEDHRGTASGIRLRFGGLEWLKSLKSHGMKTQNRTDIASASPTFTSLESHDAVVARLRQIVQHTSFSTMGSTSPTRESSKLFSPLRLGTMNLEHRVVMSPMTRLRCPGGVPTPSVTEYYAQRATKGGLLITEGMHPSLMVCLPTVPNVL